MGLFDFFKRQPLPPTNLHEALLQAADRQDWQTLAALCEQHQQKIRESFPVWKQVPEHKDPETQNRYCQGLLAVAQAFEQAGDRSLIELLIGNEADNPIIAWEQDLVTAQSLIEDARPSEAVELLQSVLAKIAGLRGSAVEHYLPRTYGMLGAAYFRTGERVRAVEFIQKAKVLCEELGDEEGVAVYARNLRHIEGSGTVIFRGADDRELTLDELRGETGKIRYEILGNTSVPAEAKSLHKQAREAGGSGDYQKAIGLLEQAGSLAPDWPYPAYDMAFTYLLMKDYENAIRYYQKTVELAPRGFFKAITALDALGREEKGDLPAGTYLTYLSLEWMDDPGKKAQAVRQLLKQVPSFAPAWKELAVLTDDDAEKAAAIEKGLAATPDAETKGILQINKAMMLDGDGDHHGAVRLLGELALDPSSTYGTEHIAKVTLEMLAKK